MGKGVLYSFITTFGSFIIFTQISDLAGRRARVATAIAIAVAFVATLLIVPLFYPLADKKVNAREHDRQDVPVVESRHVEVWTGDRRESKVIDAHE